MLAASASFSSGPPAEPHCLTLPKDARKAVRGHRRNEWTDTACTSIRCRVVGPPRTRRQSLASPHLSARVLVEGSAKAASSPG